MTMTRYSEPYSATGGLAAEGVLNQLGRPDIEAFEMLTREAVQNSWDAKRQDQPGVRVEIGRVLLDAGRDEVLRREVLSSPPPGLTLREELLGQPELLYFADFGTAGLGGPTRADELQEGSSYDFVDFVRNIGTPPDKELGGGSFGYGKAAFYLASRARTILVDTLCQVEGGRLERRFIACALGRNYVNSGKRYTGRHWWGHVAHGVPEPLIGQDAARTASLLGLPSRETRADLGTTVVVVAPDWDHDEASGAESTMRFVAECLAWNFWPRMVSTPGGIQSTMTFTMRNEGRAVPVPNPRTHERLRGFVEAFDLLRSDPDEDGDPDPFVTDRRIRCQKPIRDLGRLVLIQGAIAPISLGDGPSPQGARDTEVSLHHIALMRNAELVVRYFPGPEPAGGGRFGYSGVFRCDKSVDQAFRSAEPPTHDNWNYRAMPAGTHDRTFVKVALERIRGVAREAAGWGVTTTAASGGESIPLGEFADSLAVLMPGFEGPGARRSSVGRPRSSSRSTGKPATPTWVDGDAPPTSPDPSENADAQGSEVTAAPRRSRPPQTRPDGDPTPALGADGRAVLRFPFVLRSHGQDVQMSAHVQVMTNDGSQVESEAPVGLARPKVGVWVRPDGVRAEGPVVTVSSDVADGKWAAEVPIEDEAMMRLVLEARPA